jgi:hypothetical protein
VDNLGEMIVPLAKPYRGAMPSILLTDAAHRKAIGDHDPNW